jgi:hypothetical protein
MGIRVHYIVEQLAAGVTMATIHQRMAVGAAPSHREQLPLTERRRDCPARRP